jgi:hypothetical protein
LRLSARRQTALFAVLLFVAGLAYRATFLNQAFNASDEAFLPAVAMRIVKGQVIYRDFIYASPPLTPYKEAAVAFILGDAYGFFASRWVFAVEASLGTVIAFLIIRRFLGPWPAFLVTLPTVFFTTVLYAYSNFNFDAQILFLAGFLLLVWDLERERWPLVMLAGACCGLAFLAKPTYLAMAVGVCGLGLLRTWFGGPRRWPLFAAGFAIVVGLVFLAIAGAGLWDQFRHQSFGLLLQARPVSKRQLIYQDWPNYLLPPGRAAVPALAAAILLGLAKYRTRLGVPAIVLLGGILAALVVPALPSSTIGIPTNGQLNLLVGGLALVLAINLVASLVTVAARLPTLYQRPWAARVRAELFPPLVPIVAAVLEYLHGVDLSSMRFAYVGTFLGVPVALAFLYMGWRLWGGASVVRMAMPGAVGVFIAVAGAVVTHGSPYLDGPRDQMTATFTSTRLAGISTVPSKAAHVNDLVAEIERDTGPGDSTFVFPDGQGYYVLTGRTNPTKVDWFDIEATTPAMTIEALDTLKTHPPQWVYVQLYNESDISHSTPLNFSVDPRWQPIFDFIIANYDLVRTVDGVQVYRLK